jgi:hypothetical protein
VDIEGLYYSSLLSRGSVGDLRLVQREHVSELWQVVHDWIVAFVQQERQLPQAITLEQTFYGRTPLGSAQLPQAYEAPSHYAGLIRENAMRLAMEAGFSEKVGQPLRELKPGEALAGAKSVISDVSRQFRDLDRGLVLPEMSVSTQARYADYQFRKIAGTQVGVPTPWPSLTRATGGPRPGEMWVILARPNMGKSLASAVMATFQRECGLRVLYVSMETPPMGALPKDPRHRVVGYGATRRCIRCFDPAADPAYLCPAAATPRQRLTIRFDSLGARVSMWRFLNGQLTPLEETALQKYYRRCERYPELGWGPLKIVAAPYIRSVMDLETEILELQPDVVFWDSAYLAIPHTGAKKMNEAASEFIVDTKLMLERVAVPGILTWHFNRDIDRDAMDATQNSAALTDEVGRVSDVMLGLFRPPNIVKAGEAMMKSLKVRDGLALSRMRTRFEVKERVDFRELAEPEDEKQEAAKDAPAEGKKT